jgi:predicted TIM-barrel fold metal-dependent hydrolase
VYADFSYSFYSQAHVNGIFNTLSTHPFLKNKVMYGSDFYMCQIEKGTLADYYKYVKSVFGHDTEINDNFFVKNAIRFLMA